MITANHILVAVNQTLPIQAALERALVFAKQNPITITLFSCVYDATLDVISLMSNQSTLLSRADQLNQRDAFLQSLIDTHRSKNIEFKKEVVWHNHFEKALAYYANDLNVDLIIKELCIDAPYNNPFKLPEDWNLMRHCNASLMLVMNKEWHPEQPILCAVSSNLAEKLYFELDHKIVDFGQSLALLTGSETHVCNSHDKPEFEMVGDTPSMQSQAIASQQNGFHSEMVEAIVNWHPQTEVMIHISEGLPEEKILETLNKSHAQMLVLGCMGRKGIDALLTGNLAEQILSRQQCEMLIVKPDKKAA